MLPRLFRLAPAALWMGAAALFACGPGADEAAPPVAPEAPRYVGAEVCGTCHAAALAGWRGSHHDLAMQEAREGTVLGDFGGATLEQAGVTSTFLRRGGRFVVRTEGADGRLADFEVAHTFGADPLQQYLVRFPDGRVQALGLAWDARPEAEGGQRWLQLFPEARPGDPLHWTGIDQTWNFTCAECHSTHLEKGYDPRTDRYATTWAEPDVACEACHGPGSAHVDAMRAKRTGKAPRAPAETLALGADFEGRGAWVRAPGEATARLATPRVARREVDTCGRCHARRGQLADGSAAGTPLLDSHRPALLEEGLYFADGQIQDEVYVWGSFLQSRMYAAGVACSDCHDPHALRIADSEAACARCHDPAVFAAPAHHHHPDAPEGARCVACHMPARVTMQVDARRDHGFRVPRPDLSVRLGTPNACNGCHGDRDARWAAQQVVRWFPEGRSGTGHFAETLDAGRRGAADAHAALARVVDDATQPAIVRATAVRLLADAPGPRSRATVRTGAAHPDPLLRLAAAGALRALSPRDAVAIGAPLLRDPRLAVRTEAAAVLSALPPSLWHAPDRAALAAALDEHRAVQRTNADRPEAHVNLGVLHARAGDREAARQAYERALRLDPRFTPAAVNLADLHREAGREPEAERVLREALERTPGAAALHHALGLSLVRQGRREEALGALARADALAPDAVRFARAHALALHAAGRSEEALAVLRAAHARREGDRDVHVTLVTLLRDTGHTAEALDHARALAAWHPDTPEARALVTQLEAAAP